MRVWGTADGRLIEVLACPGVSFRVEGIPAWRARAVADRVRAALVNSGVAAEAPAVVVRLSPAVSSGDSWGMDLPVALAALGVPGGGWVFAEGRLGLGGEVHGPGVTVDLADICAGLPPREPQVGRTR